MTTLLVAIGASLAQPAEPAPKPVLQVRFELRVEKYARLYPDARKAALEAEVLKGPSPERGGLIQALQETFPFVEFTDQDHENRVTISLRPDRGFDDIERAVRTHFHLQLEGPNVRGGTQVFSEWQFRDANEYHVSVKPQSAFRGEIVDCFRGYLEKDLTREQLMGTCVSSIKLCPGGTHEPASAEFILPLRCQDHHIDEALSEFFVPALIQRPMEANRIERLYRARGNGRVRGGEHDGSVRAQVEESSRQEVSQSTIEVLGVYILRYRLLRDCGLVAPSEFEIP